MSLKQKLSFLTGFIVVAMLLGNLSLTLVQAKRHFEELLNARAYDAATSLALSLTQQTQATPEQQQRLIDVLFDRGFFSEITLNRSDNTQVSRLDNEQANTHIPNWFAGLFSFEVMPAQASVSRGWQQLGELTVKSHTKLAYDDLWDMFITEIKWFLLVLILSLVILQLVLRLLLSPLKKAEEQALSISDKHWVKQKDIPSTREFRRLALAMNQMVDKLESIFDIQAKSSEILRAQSFEDTITGTLNRRGFDQKVTHILESSQEHSGFLVILHLEHFAQYNRKYGREKGDELLVLIAKNLKEHFRANSAAVIGRHRGADFALYVPCVDRHQAKESLTELDLHLNEFKTLISPVNVLIGSVFLQDERDTLNNALSQADFSLRQAQSLEGGKTQSTKQLGKEVLNASQWRSSLLDVIQSGGLEIEYLPVFDAAKQEPVQFEVLSRINLLGERLSGARFWPMVEFHKLSPDFDLQVLKCLAKDFERLPKGHRYCINFSHLSVANRGFHKKLYDFLESHSLLARFLAIEISETAVNENEENFSALIEELSPVGVKFGVDNFGTGKQSFAYLKRLNIDYLRIDGSLNRGLHKSQDNQFYLQSMVQIAHSLDIKIIAEGLEDKKDIEVLIQAGVDNISGFYFSKSLVIDEVSALANRKV